MSSAPYLTVWHNGRQVVQDRESTRRLRRPAPWTATIAETVRAVAAPDGTRLFRLRDHLARLLETARRLRMEVAFGPEELAEACRAVARVNALRDGLLHPTLRRDLTRGGAAEAAVGVSEARDEEAALTEAVDSVFFVHGAWLTAAPLGAPGVMQDTVAALARDRGWTVRDGELSTAALESAVEVFAAGTGVGVVPAQAIEGDWAAGGREGPVTRALSEAFEGLFDGRTADRWGWFERVDLWPAPRYAEPVA
jgi:branched-subunit amino acid aminotransferase/4-amino-4-deoxychorismate lyase